MCFDALCKISALYLRQGVHEFVAEPNAEVCVCVRACNCFAAVAGVLGEVLWGEGSLFTIERCTHYCGLRNTSGC